MDENSVVFKGSVNGLTIILRQEDDFQAIIRQVESKIQSAGRFFKDATLAIKYRGRKLSREEEQQLLKMITEKGGAKVKSFEEDTEEPVKIEKSPEASASKPKFRMRSYFFKGIEEGVAKFHRGTVRSGQSIDFDGNLVVIGDVNPGGQVVATGNVIVMGALRGIVHAGADGNKEAVIVAFNLQPTQLRIADVITRPPDEKEPKGQPVPEIAYVKEDIVYIERYLPQK